MHQLRKVMLGLAIVGVLGALFIPWMAVPSINPHEGAIGASHVTLVTHSLPLAANGTPQAYVFTSSPDATPAVGTIQVGFETAQYTGPKPVYKSPWDLYFASSFATRPGYITDGSTTGEINTGCTTSYLPIKVTKVIKAKITSADPDGKTETWSDTKTIELTAKRTVRTCTDAQGKQTSTVQNNYYDQDVVTTWTVGTFYLTHGVGTYTLTTELYDMSLSTTPKIASTTVSVVAPASWATK